MNRKIEPAGKTEDTTFHWTRDPEFVLPGNRLDVCVAQEFAPTRSSELRALLNTSLETALAFIKARAGVIRVLLPDEQTLQVISAVGLTNQELEAERIVDLTCENCRKDAFRRGLCTTDLHSCEARLGDQPDRHFRSVISIPLKSRDTQESLLGVFTLFFDTPQSSSGQAANMAIRFADLLGALLEHVREWRETKRGELLHERQSIANEIHDSLAQNLNFARMSTTLLSEAIRAGNELMATKYTRDIDEALESSQKTVRALITNFRSEMDPAGLLQALHKLVKRFSEQYPIVLDASIRIADLDLPLEYEIQTYHIVREALSNIAKHSNASHARLIVDHLCGYYVFTVEDNGVGTFSQMEGHYGIVIMQERARRIGGEVRIESTKGLGTCVQLFFPEPRISGKTTHGQ